MGTAHHLRLFCRVGFSLPPPREGGRLKPTLQGRDGRFVPSGTVHRASLTRGLARGGVTRPSRGRDLVGRAHPTRGGPISDRPCLGPSGPAADLTHHQAMGSPRPRDRARTRSIRHIVCFDIETCFFPDYQEVDHLEPTHSQRPGRLRLRSAGLHSRPFGTGPGTRIRGSDPAAPRSADIVSTRCHLGRPGPRPLHGYNG